MLEMVTAIVCDDGETTLAECIKSLRNQTIPVRIVLASGPKTDLDLAGKLADKVYPATRGIGKARVNAILNEKDEFLLSCDSDTTYSQNYAEIAVEDLKVLNVVKAGMILPRGDYVEDDPVLAWFEAIISPWVPYEFALAFRRSAFLEAGIQGYDYESNPRSDIGVGVHRRLIPLISDLRMVCWSRMPTKGAMIVRDDYLPSMLGVTLPFGAICGVIGLNEFRRLYSLGSVQVIFT
ncbi:MAG: hypothetical protein ACE5PO_09115 [Candidatus Bathyarchaeia archaeon]